MMTTGAFEPTERHDASDSCHESRKGMHDERKEEGERITICPVPDIINTATRRGIGSNGPQTEEVYARVQTKGSTGKYAA
jgi:hypothetical protein